MADRRQPIIDFSLEPLPVRSPWRDRLLAAMPVVAILLLLGLVVMVLSTIDAGERERSRTTLISDALWVEQTLRFQLATDEDAVSRLAFDLSDQPDPARTLRERGRLLVATNPEIIAIAWLSADGRLRAAVPEMADEGQLPPAAVDVARRASFTARPLYGELRDQGGQLVVDLTAAVREENGAAGAVVAVLSVSNLIQRHVPWWIAERYAVRLEDDGGRILAEKARVEPFDRDLYHRIAFDPPLRATLLGVAPYRSGTGSLNRTLYAAIAGFATLALVSLAVLQRHVVRRRAVEQRLLTEMAFRRAMENSLTVGMRARDQDGRILYVNPAFCRMVGFPAKELIGRGQPMPYWIPDEISETKARHDAQIHGERKPTSWETRFRRADGTIFDALVYEAPLVDGDGEIRGWMGSIIDITDRKAAAEFTRRQAESLQRSSRLVTLGEMASTLAHELNQPLAAIASYATGSLNLIRAGDPDLPAVAGAMEKLSGQAQRAGAIIRRIQDFVRKREPRFAAVPMADVVRETIAFASIDARTNGIRIEEAVQPGLPPVQADRILIEQVLLNLIRNGAEAMAGCPPERRRLTVSVFRQDDALMVEVADRGPGVDPEVAGRLFEAFLSTKADGMGIGLNICRSIVELHRGRLVHRPNPEGGSIFAFVLPLALSEVA